jgi:N-acetylglutamate synthase
MTTDLIIRPMTAGDIPEVISLWRSSEGIGMAAGDDEAGIRAFLARNPDLSLVVRDRDRLAAAILCGHDGRRGYLHHLAVAPEFRRRGIGREIARRCVAGLNAAGIRKCHLLVYSRNTDAIEFWRSVNWGMREDLRIMSRMTSPEL